MIRTFFRAMASEVTSIHSHQIAEVHKVPMRVIIRPFPPEVDEEKVKSIMHTLEVN
ncbi:putative sulfiredoxin [Homalodisca vitripennis]|uniref:putative sulfiredoxin n=1 Tax=Homalodisca vitripennis TaxID=197043 RepID=UPI001EEC3D28|nr:putative sulfiredoxin [Homalodisca vitripennis]